MRDTVAEIESLATILAGSYSATSDLNEFMARSQRLTFLNRKLELLLNPNEEDHKQLLDRLRRYSSKVLLPVTQGGELKEYAEKLKDIDAQAEGQASTRLAQSILKREWERVKRGR